MSNELGRDKFRIDPSRRPELRRLLRLKGSTPDKRQVWVLTLDELEHLYRTLSRHMSRRIKEECLTS